MNLNWVILIIGGIFESLFALSLGKMQQTTGVSINTALGRMRYAILNIRKMATDNRMILTIN
jgi:hypothetical protein